MTEQRSTIHPRGSRRPAATIRAGTQGAARTSQFYHTPVLSGAVVEALCVQPRGRYIDCTVGEGGHASAILEAGGLECRVLALDLDPLALEAARRRLASYGDRVVLVQESFAAVAEVARQHGFLGADGVLMDLGLSSLQLEGETRGFSFQRDAPLDMRFDPRQHLTAADIVNGSTEEDLAQILARYGEERRARRISRAIIRGRPVGSTLELARLVERAVGGRRGRLHPATLTFQALRVAVNRELENLEVGLNHGIKLLGVGGRLAVISYESLSDRLVKGAFRRASAWCICPPGSPICTCGHSPEVRLLTRKPITASLEEVQRNPRSRSARLRVAERL